MSCPQIRAQLLLDGDPDGPEHLVVGLWLTDRLWYLVRAAVTPMRPRLTFCPIVPAYSRPLPRTFVRRALVGMANRVLTFTIRSLPIAFIADYSSNRVWTLCCAVVWWSLMVIFQGLSNRFWQLICARLGMSFGQSASEAVGVQPLAPWPD